MDKTKNSNELNKKKNFADASIKEIIADPVIQSALKARLQAPPQVLIKKIRKPYRPKNADEDTPETQKVEAVYGTSLMDVQTIDMTLVGITLDKQAINHYYRIVDYTYGLIANMSGSNFSGYSATGFKLLITRLEEVQNNAHETP